MTESTCAARPTMHCARQTRYRIGCAMHFDVLGGLSEAIVNFRIKDDEYIRNKVRSSRHEFVVFNPLTGSPGDRKMPWHPAGHFMSGSTRSSVNAYSSSKRVNLPRMAYSTDEEEWGVCG